MKSVSRRGALKLAATGAAFAGTGMVVAQNAGQVSDPNPPARSLNGWFDVTSFGAKGDGKSPAEEPIRHALAEARKIGGGVIWFPAGRYLIEAKVVVEHQVTILGAGWASRDTSQGAWIYVRKPGVNLEIRGQGTLVQGIGFIQEQPSPDAADWQPAEHLFAIQVVADDVFLKQLNLFNCTKGVGIANAGRVILDHIWGRPLRCGIQIDEARDVIKINNVHFWPFWQEGNATVEKWTQAHGTGIEVLRADNPQFSNIFVISYNRGIAFGASAKGVTSKFAITNADCDYCETGVEIGGSNVSGSITNLNSQGGPGETGISIISPGVKLQATNVRLTNYRGNAIRATGANTRLFINNLWAEMWNQSKTGFPAVEATDGAVIYLGRPLFFDRGNGGANWRRDGINGGRVLTGYDELVSAQS